MISHKQMTSRFMTYITAIRTPHRSYITSIYMFWYCSVVSLSGNQSLWSCFLKHAYSRNLLVISGYYLEGKAAISADSPTVAFPKRFYCWLLLASDAWHLNRLKIIVGYLLNVTNDLHWGQVLKHIMEC